MKDWMTVLANHYNFMREEYPTDKLMVVFDIDDTIIDVRIAILFVLRKYDFDHKTNYFDDIELESINKEKDHTELFNKLKIDEETQNKIYKYLEDNLWTYDTILASHSPFKGVLEIMRWIQIQENSYVGLNTGRSEKLRKVTLLSLNTLGDEYRVNFSSDLLYMNQSLTKSENFIENSKVEGIRYFQDKGFRVIAMIDNEPANLKAIHDKIVNEELLLFHAETLFRTPIKLKPKKAITGESYNLKNLIDKKHLPRHIQFVWDGVNDRENMIEFLSSNITWAELDVYRDPYSKKLILRHEDPKIDPRGKREKLFLLKTMVADLIKFNRSVKFVLKENGELLSELIVILKELKVPQDKIWFNTYVEKFDENSFQNIKRSFPNAIISAYVDFLIPICVKMPKKAKEILEELATWGYNRFSISFSTPYKNKFMAKMEEWGYNLDIRNVYSLEDFLKAVILNPSSISSNFYFPKWSLYGKNKIMNEISTV